MPKKRPYAQFCPIARALDVIGDRWSMLIVRELFLGPTRYGELLDALRTISTDVLAKRLRELDSSRVIERDADGRYDLTHLGRSLGPVLKELGRWGWPLLGAPDGELDVAAAHALQMLIIATSGMDLGAERTMEIHAGDMVSAITTSADGLVARRGPATRPDAVVTTDGATLWAIGSGDVPWADAVESGDMEIDGDPMAVEQLFAGPAAARAGT